MSGRTLSCSWLRAADIELLGAVIAGFAGPDAVGEGLGAAHGRVAVGTAIETVGGLITVLTPMACLPAIEANNGRAGRCFVAFFCTPPTGSRLPVISHFQKEGADAEVRRDRSVEFHPSMSLAVLPTSMALPSSSTNVEYLPVRG